MVVEVPVAIDNDISMVKVEIQIRSLAMDFWASLEHKKKYKPNLISLVSKPLEVYCVEMNSPCSKTFF